MQYVPELNGKLRAYVGPPITQFTEGDLHGNTIRLLHSLAYYRIVDIDAGSYQKIVLRYQVVLQGNIRYNKELRLLIQNNIRVIDTTKLVRLIGDVLAERTGNDLFTLTLISLLVRNRVPIRILISNHDLHFILTILNATTIEEVRERFANARFFKYRDQGISLLRLIESLERGEISFEEVQQLCQDYFSTLVLLDYAIDEPAGKMELFSHAPTNLRTLRALAEQFGITYPEDESNHAAKITMIHQMNKIFKTYLQLARVDIIANLFDEASHTPASRIVWAREVVRDKQNRIISRHAFIDPALRIKNIYGHHKDPEALIPDPENVIRLDTKVGRGHLDNPEKEMTSYASNHAISATLELISEGLSDHGQHSPKSNSSSKSNASPKLKQAEYKEEELLGQEMIAVVEYITEQILSGRGRMTRGREQDQKIIFLRKIHTLIVPTQSYSLAIAEQVFGLLKTICKIPRLDFFEPVSVGELETKLCEINFNSIPALPLSAEHFRALASADDLVSFLMQFDGENPMHP